MLSLIIVVAVLHLVGTVILLVAWFKAPAGYEDENGFHYGEEQEPQPYPSSSNRHEPSVTEDQEASFGIAQAIRGTR